MNNELNFNLDIFEGPLDLLLHLIFKHKLNIYDIKIFELLEQYMKFIDKKDKTDLNISTEFIEMAARLVYIKTISLIPKNKHIEKEKQKLTGILLEYHLCKIVAENIKLRYIEDKIFFREGEKSFINQKYSLVHDKNILFDRYSQLILKSIELKDKPIDNISNLVNRKFVSIQDKIDLILESLLEKKYLSYYKIFKKKDKSDIVATFSAVLELVKTKKIILSNDNEHIYLNIN
ncbi:MAG: segregation/condensation protein A [Oscillospiraceae bacterium]|nr:segregation/condensation protein A [Oscillospiraceae bacterium]